MILQLVRGFPSSIASTPIWVEVCRRDGLMAAHKQLLEELRDWFLGQSDYAGRSAKIAEQAHMFDSAMIYGAREADIEVPSLRERDDLFAGVFGPAGRKLVDRLQAEADEEVYEFMRETGIEDETLARQLLVDEYVGGMEFFVEHGREIGREANVMSQIEDVIGPVDWDDMGEE